MLFRDISILDENFELQEHMYVGVKDRKIGYIGKEAPADTQGYLTDGGVYDGRNRLLMSAFVNAHAHSAMTLMRGYGESMKLQEWLNDKIFPFEDHLYGEAVYWATSLAVAESLKTGIVSTSDMYYFCSDIARAVMDSGAKMNISRSVSHFSQEDPRQGMRYADAEQFIKEWHGCGMGRILADASIHSEYTSTPDACRAVTELAQQYGVGMQIHVSETRAEHEACISKYGKTPVRYLYDLGVFDVPTTAAHCVWIEEEDLDLLKDKNVTVATCPVSNMKLAGGIADVTAMLKKGINVALGTDSVASNNSLQFPEEMKLMAIGAKVRDYDPTRITPREALRIATVNGAVSQGRKDCGLLKEGFRADLIVVDLTGPNMHPIHCLQNNLVYSTSDSDILLTMADGEVLYRNGEYLTIDIEKAVAETENAVRRILGEL